MPSNGSPVPGVREPSAAGWLLGACVLWAACSPPAHVTLRAETAGVQVATVTLPLSNVHVIFGAHPVLVDTGSPGELDLLAPALSHLGVDLDDIRCVVVTHGHADHAGNARALQLRGIKLIAGTGDLWREINGVHGHLTATGWFAVLLKPVIPGHYEPFWPDIRLSPGEHFDLAPCGVPGEVVAMPGHTQGSLVVFVNGGKVAFVGDLFRGGALAGYVHQSEPKEHFYQDDLPLVHQRIHELLARGVQWFVLGHGGPSRREDVERVFGRQ
jgi:glyoxylase-like metal-dependent hydrolase (beta-lactamase superfamily II)